MPSSFRRFSPKNGTTYRSSWYSYLSIVCGFMDGRGQVDRTRISVTH